jgi:hypothetical protein
MAGRADPYTRAVRCLYCKESSESSRSVEHVVPESLGNATMILPRGAVCDGCNNYFSRKVEAPFLTSPLIQALRHDQGLLTKKGRRPGLRMLAGTGGWVTMFGPDGNKPGRLEFDSDEAAHRWAEQGRLGGTMVTHHAAIPPSQLATSRFFAKVALGCLAVRFIEVDGGLESLVDEPELDPIRDHARRGTDPAWPVSRRRIYPADALWNEGGQADQKVWEHDLFEDDGFLFSVFILFGLEYVINVGGPDLAGYERWLTANRGASPLYTGRYASELSTLVDPGPTTPPS